jgi:two-component system NtrC family sensor kinase
MLAPLGWLAIAAHDPDRVAGDLETLRANQFASDWQQSAWGLDHTAIARRLGRMWRLPAWLTTITGHLGLHVGIAERLGADPHLFRVAQLAVLLCKPHDLDLGLPVGAGQHELLRHFDLSAEDADTLVRDVLSSPLPDAVWEAPTHQPLLIELLHLAAENRRGSQTALVEGLQQDLDRLQEALTRHGVEEKQRLHAMKLESLAEFAAGAGHEINNPLAVISGQAQYILKQFELFDGPAADIEDVAEFLNALREKITPSLHKIVRQTHRVHSILTDLMQFARPATPKVQAVPVGRLIRDVNAVLKELADSRKVSLVDTDVPAEWAVLGDPTQVKHALTGLLRNAIEAAPPEGWAGVRVEMNAKGLVDLVIEDNGAGPTPAMHEHLFDPFYSGRNAGRGRGLGLPTAWRLARQHGGDVRFDGSQRGLTRFVLSLPVALESPAVLPLNGNGKHERNGHNGTHLEAAS